MSTDDGVLGDERSFLILYATETGNAIDVAQRIRREGHRRHFQPRIANVDEYPAVSTCARWFQLSSSVGDLGGAHLRDSGSICCVHHRYGRRASINDQALEDAHPRRPPQRSI